MTLTDELSDIVGQAFEAEGMSKAAGAVRFSDRPDLAQFQCNGALAAAKERKANPRMLAEGVVARLRQDGRFREVSVAGPGFINLALTDEDLSRRVEIANLAEGLGGWTKAPETIVLDYGGPNVAKPLHVGHLRSAIIGEALKRILRAAGDDVIGDIHLGDWGLQMGQLISELELRRPELPYFAAGAAGPFPAAAPITLADLEDMYPAASAACREDPTRADLARKATKALQDGKPGYRALWRHFVDLSVAALRRDYADLDVDFDLWKGEADVDPLIPGMIADLEAKGLVELSDGAKIIRLAEEGDKKEIPPIILVNSEGAVGYHATDIATIIDRVRTNRPDRIFYVVDGRQALHFEQVFRASGRAGYFPSDRLEHLWFGTMNGKDGKPFKTRAGGVLKLRDLIDLVEGKALERLTESGLAKDYPEAETREVTRKVAVAALKFADLSNPRTTDYVFDLDRFMSFEGKTGPYLLYAAVRIRSLLVKGKEAGAIPGALRIAAAEERDLALSLLAFGDMMRLACEKRMPHHLCEHVFNLAQAFSRFYAGCRIVDEPTPEVRASRLALAAAAGRQIEHALDLLGIAVPARM
ncbi:MAG: arginine--tRNA ligase [Parvularculaceae bacterium]|jgi:arginyl-tRNA synthetase|nr:arginine--tRNA ligase [Parvularculaceae bacterium]